jgi:hypothetical protein
MRGMPSLAMRLKHNIHMQPSWLCVGATVCLEHSRSQFRTPGLVNLKRQTVELHFCYTPLQPTLSRASSRVA